MQETCTRESSVSESNDESTSISLPRLGISAIRRFTSLGPRFSLHPPTTDDDYPLDAPAPSTRQLRPGTRTLRIMEFANFRVKRMRLVASRMSDADTEDETSSSTQKPLTKKLPLRIFRQNSPSRLKASEKTPGANKSNRNSLGETGSTLTWAPPTKPVKSDKSPAKQKIRWFSSSSPVGSRRSRAENCVSDSRPGATDNRRERKRRSTLTKKGTTEKSRRSCHVLNVSRRAVDTSRDEEHVAPTDATKRARSPSRIAYDAVKRIFRGRSKERPHQRC
uniref:Uncharacterized protein n=1 Tax=Mesocestoides corti TaxID=53468 RepID=A0A5K3FU12_MESCO